MENRKWPIANDDEDGQLTFAATGKPMRYWMITTTDDKGNEASTAGE
jgi:hypothetical protein